MNKSDVYLIISQIYCVGGLIIDKNRGFLYVFGTIWLILSFAAWGVK